MGYITNIQVGVFEDYLIDPAFKGTFTKKRLTIEFALLLEWAKKEKREIESLKISSRTDKGLFLTETKNEINEASLHRWDFVSELTLEASDKTAPSELGYFNKEIQMFVAKNKGLAAFGTYKEL